MYNEIERRRTFMGLHMYLCRATKKKIEDLNHLKEVENDLDKMWKPIIANELPKNHPWEYSKMTEQQRKLYDEMNDEFYVINQKRIAIRDEIGDNILYFFNFNTLHKYIVDNFADGVDECQLIPLTKDDVVQILNYLNKEMSSLSTVKNQKIFINDIIYSDNITRAIGIFSMVIRDWDDDFGVWYSAYAYL